MKNVELTEMPAAPYEIHLMPGGMAMVTFYTNCRLENRDDRTQPICDAYSMTVPYSVNLPSRIDDNYEAWLGAAYAKEYAELAKSAREKRAALLATCDYIMAADYPASENVRAEWATYRQALRDVPEQPGFPWEVKWPERP